jgi:Acyl-CoA reductase (LuxC)
MIERLKDAADAGALARRVAAALSLIPFSEELLAFTSELSSVILSDRRSRPLPEVVALGYWLRPASMRALADRFSGLNSSHAVRVPVGLALHIPPANVDPIFVYSWILSLLCGNCNIVRTPSRRGPVAELLLTQIDQVLPHFSRLAGATAFVEYGHEDSITEALSAQVSMRVIWGGDETIRHIRALPLPPRAKEVVFADRYSFAVIGALAFLALDDGAAKGLMDQLCMDIFLFNQMACSSVRLLAWCGTSEATRKAAGRAIPLLREALERRRFSLEAADALAKYGACQSLAIDLPVAGIDWGAGRLAVVDLKQGQPLQWPAGPLVGGGLLLQAHVTELAALTPIINSRTQTLTQFGFEIEQLAQFLRMLNGRGIDRIVPLGSAMNFAPIWDGYDLLCEFTRLATIG